MTAPVWHAVAGRNSRVEAHSYPQACMAPMPTPVRAGYLIRSLRDATTTPQRPPDHSAQQPGVQGFCPRLRPQLSTTDELTSQHRRPRCGCGVGNPQPTARAAPSPGGPDSRLRGHRRDAAGARGDDETSRALARQAWDAPLIRATQVELLSRHRFPHRRVLLLQGHVRRSQRGAPSRCLRRH